MAQFMVLEKSFIDNALVEEGTVIEYAGVPGPNLQLLDGEVLEKYNAAEDLRRQHAAAASGDPNVAAALINDLHAAHTLDVEKAVAAALANAKVQQDAAIEAAVAKAIEAFLNTPVKTGNKPADKGASLA